MAELRKPRSVAGTWPPRGASSGWSPSRTGLFAPLVERVITWARAEAGPGRMMPWIAVAFACGIAFYFAAPREPVLWVASATAALLCGAAILLRRRRAFSIVIMLAAVAAGFAIATWKTARVAHPVLTKPIYVATLKGYVEARDIRERTDRFVLRVTQMSTPRDSVTLDRVRLSVKKGAAPAVGSFVELKARLLPPLSPARPGSYDFGRDMYFQGIGASGFVMGAITLTEAPSPPTLRLRYAALMQGLRDAIDARIGSTLSGDTRAIATALLTGRRDAISAPVNDAMFISGLGHVLSISGYHMAVVAGVVFFAARALLALIPVLTVMSPIKKWAAAAALAAAAFYLALSGAEIATQRSFLMTAIVLIAIMVDRRAITFRTLAIAALAVLAIAPEALVHPSFQMSFAATLGLVALVQIGMPALFASPDHGATARAALWGVREIVVLLLASLIAGMATMPYAAFHFHRVTPYGVLANLLAMPVVSAMVMPAGLLGLAAMPFGFDSVFWRIMAVGIEWMVWVAQWIAALPGAIGRITAFEIGALAVASAGIVLLGLLRTPLRWSGLALIAVAIVWAALTPSPDILVAADGRNVAVRGVDGRLRLMRSGKDAFLVKQWLAADADARSSEDPSLTEGVSCDEDGCVVALRGGGLVALALRPQALADDCARASVVVTDRPTPAACAALVIDRDKRAKNGAQILRQTHGGNQVSFAISVARPNGDDRPWSRAVAEGDGEGQVSTRGSRQGRPPQPVDATPAEPDREIEE